MRVSADRANRFVFDDVVEQYVSGRPDLPVEAVCEGAAAVGVPAGARVLEIGAGAGQLTVALDTAGFEIVALEPGAALRRRAATRVPAATLVAETFESFEPRERFDAIFSSNAFHWVDPAVSYTKAAGLAPALVLLWDVAFPAEAELFRRIQHEVMRPRGSTFPDAADEVRGMLERDAADGRDDLVASGRFADPWWRISERTLSYTPARYVDLVGSLGGVAAAPDREEILAELKRLLGDEPVDVLDLVYVVAARAVAA